ncbi:MAG: hypothetical protein FWB96_06770 [Defluviitaleaceae bacterium]|nr:hypothetical protein [Defluviitaleaceae bacterium]MCL2262603.1 hypothetical protein [Defluviitaleaceae bacterium]
MRIAKIFCLFFVAILVLVGCASEVEVTGLIPRDIRLLIIDATDVRLHTLLEIVDGNLLKSTVFSNSSDAVTDEIFDIAIVNEFLDKDNSLLDLSLRRSVGDFDSPHFVIHSSERVLSPRQLNNIWELAENVVRNGRSADELFLAFDSVSSVWHGGIFVWSIIDGELRMSQYFPDIKRSISCQYTPEWVLTHCEELLFLTYYFIDISSVIGLEMNPATWKELK